MSSARIQYGGTSALSRPVTKWVYSHWGGGMELCTHVKQHLFPKVGSWIVSGFILCCSCWIFFSFCFRYTLQMPQFLHRSHRTTCNVSPHLTPCLKQGLLFTAHQVKPAGLQDSRVLREKPPACFSSQWNYKCQLPHQASCELWGSEL